HQQPRQQGKTPKFSDVSVAFVLTLIMLHLKLEKLMQNWATRFEDFKASFRSYKQIKDSREKIEGYW
ncbi:hypothetical protein, partial [Serratia marcescens]|uniref:hypothetical protein n=1 Tax=Serratia marcescens TaxID=615 RepID=UPI001F47FFFE